MSLLQKLWELTCDGFQVCFIEPTTMRVIRCQLRKHDKMFEFHVSARLADIHEHGWHENEIVRLLKIGEGRILEALNANKSDDIRTEER